MIQSFECHECEAEFTVKHKLDASYYQINYCPFCGAQVDEEFLNDEEE